MSDLFCLTDERMERLRLFFPKSYGKPRVDDRRVLSGIVFVSRDGLRCRDAPAALRPAPDALYSVEALRRGRRVCAMMEQLAAGAAVPKTVMIDAT